jgi:hypothetical protein
VRSTVPEEETRATSSVAPGAITALLRDVFRLSHVDPREALPEFRPGQVIGRFELVREIGRGGFGVVYEASDRQLRRAVALKAVRVGGNLQLKEEQLLREAEAAAQLSHPNIVTLFDVGRFDDGPYLVMELLRGFTLGERLRLGSIPLREALRVGVDISRAVTHAHANGVIHRDLTARNVFLCDDGHVKVLDFGMAQAFGYHKIDGGTITYMAPEQYRGEPEDERTDVFALGVIMYEMLSGSVPFRDASALESPIEAPALEIPERPALGPFIARMLAKDPVTRPRHGHEVLAALVALQEARPAGPEGARDPPSRRRFVRPVLVAGLAALAITGAFVLPGIRTTRDPVVPLISEAAAPDPVAASEPVTGPLPAEAAKERTVLVNAAGAAEERVDAPSPALVATRPAASVRFCRDRINAVQTPEVGTGDGVLTVEADPFADVFVNGRPYGETPRECRVSAGAYKVRMIHPQYGTRERRVEVRRGERTRWTADFLAEH